MGYKPLFFSKAVLYTTDFWEVVIANVFITMFPCYSTCLHINLSWQTVSQILRSDSVAVQAAPRQAAAICYQRVYQISRTAH